MRRAVLTPSAIADVKAIWRYTRKTWGREQADRYYRLLETCFAQMARESAHF